VLDALQSAPKTTAVVNLIRRFEEEGVEETVELPKKVTALLKTLVRGGIKEALQRARSQGGNPFSPDKHRTLHGAFERVLDGACARGDLVACFVGKLGWTSASAKSEATLVWHIFKHLGIATEDGCRLVVHPSFVIQNSNITQ
jgi:hypothetical protein